MIYTDILIVLLGGLTATAAAAKQRQQPQDDAADSSQNDSLTVPLSQPKLSPNVNTHNTNQVQPNLQTNNGSHIPPSSPLQKLRVMTQGWLGTVTIGTPGADYLLSFDTAASDIWIKAYKQESRKSYNASLSFSSQLVQPNIYRQTDFGNITADAYADRMTIGLNVAQGQQFLAVQSLDQADATTLDTLTESSGIVGLALPTNQSMNIIDTFKKQGRIDQSVFAMSYGKKGSGELTIGHFNDKQYHTLYWQNILPDTSFWNVEMMLGLNSTDQGYVQREGIIDSGTRQLIVPAADAESFHWAIPGVQPPANEMGSYIIPCNSSLSLPFTYGGHNFTVPSGTLIGDPIQNGSSLCSSNIVPGNTGSSTSWVFGQAMLQNFYLGFDMDNRRVAFAEPA